MKLKSSNDARNARSGGINADYIQVVQGFNHSLTTRRLLSFTLENPGSNEYQLN